MDDARLLAHYRKLLGNGGNANELISALDRLREEKKSDDIALIVKYIGDLDPGVAAAEPVVRQASVTSPAARR